MDFADIKPSIMNAIILLLMIMIIVPTAKYAFARWYIPGLSELTALI